MSGIGFIGTGTIGGPIALRLIEHKHSLHVFDINPEATHPYVARGAQRAASVADIARTCTTVFLSLPGPVQIEEVVVGGNGLLTHARDLSTVVDLSTNSVALNRRIAEQAKALGIRYLDAPVSGGKAAARDGTLAVMVGGDESAFADVRGLLECFGAHIFYLGPAGAGTLTKLVNNQIFLVTSVVIQEGFVMAAKAGMDPSTLLEVLKVSSAGSHVARAPLVLSRNFKLGVFALAIAAKDIEMALASAESLGVSMPISAAASDVYQRAIAKELGGEDFFATVKVLEAAAGVEVPPLRKAKTERA